MEKISMLNEYENILMKKRGWISKIPDNKKCVFVFSGGLDSVSSIARVITEFDLSVFPLFINRGQTNLEFERHSIEYFNDLFIKKYPNNYNNVKIIENDIPSKSLKNDLQTYMKSKGYPLRDTFIELLAVQYAISLKNDTKTIFSANVIDDPFPHCALKAMRSTTVNVCENLDDWDWQITSPNIDQNISSNIYSKVDEIKFSTNNNIPIENSTSCYKPNIINNKIYHCGECLACKRRKQAFIDAEVEDKTLYLN